MFYRMQRKKERKKESKKVRNPNFWLLSSQEIATVPIVQKGWVESQGGQV
jgi:hypothetical protein